MHVFLSAFKEYPWLHSQWCVPSPSLTQTCWHWCVPSTHASTAVQRKLATVSVDTSETRQAPSPCPEGTALRFPSKSIFSSPYKLALCSFWPTSKTALKTTNATDRNSQILVFTPIKEDENFEFGAKAKHGCGSGNLIVSQLVHLPVKKTFVSPKQEMGRTAAYFRKFYEPVVPLQSESAFQGFYGLCLNRIHTQALS